ncbi:MAG TPA: YIP1 family protein [Gemmatimonadaceae bacterium]|jgi:hypothetical protein|nr:YIP1 family protein [Gemmatimonadaceae bacterium]
MTDATTTSSPASVSVLEDFVDIFHAPRTVYERRREAGPWVPLLVATVVYALLFWSSLKLLAPMWDAESVRTMARVAARNPQLTEAQLAAALSMQGVGMLIGAVTYVPLAVLFGGLATWIVGKFFDSQAGLRQAWMIAAYAVFPRLIEQVVVLVQGAVLDASAMTSRWAVSLSPARFMNPDAEPIVLMLADRLGPFTIWCTVLLAIGLHVVGRVPPRQAAVAGAVLWILGALPLALASGQ